jgi:hypothetical protein
MQTRKWRKSMTIKLTCHGVTARWHCRHWLPRMLYKITGRFHTICLWGKVYTRYQRDLVFAYPSMIAHEHAHVRQWRNYGWRFPFAYVWAWIAAGFSYRNNRFEVEAREWENVPPHIPWHAKPLHRAQEMAVQHVWGVPEEAREAEGRPEEE